MKKLPKLTKTLDKDTIGKYNVTIVNNNTAINRKEK
jgi:hypothetical protein